LIRHNESIIENIATYYEKYYSAITPNWKKLVNDPLNEVRNGERIENIEFLTGMDKYSVGGRRFLEIGCGFGSFVVTTRQMGFESFGLEPDQICYSTAMEILAINELPTDIIVKGVGESLPYDDNSFDYVVSFQVLEHTQDPAKVLKEAIRVLKPGGYLYFNIPNHNFIWEAHYGLIWPTFLPRSITKLYLKLRGRDPKFFDSIQLLNKRKLMEFIANSDIEIIGFGETLWEKRMDSLNFSTYGHTKKLYSILNMLAKFKGISIAKMISIKLNMFYPLILVGRKY